MILLLVASAAAVLGALGAYALFFTAFKAADPSALSRRVAAVEARLARLEQDV